MKFVADLHIHSPYSRATSSKLTPENLDYYAKIKGIDLLATGDALHPKWLEILKEKLTPLGNGLFEVKKEYKLPIDHKLDKPVYFVLNTEISTIYKKQDKVRKIHQLIFFPDFVSLEKTRSILEKIGNLNSDGRPILGLDSKKLLEISLESNQKNLFIPAHIWTPWFSLFGANSGFDALTNCFEDLSTHIFALETGLSSDPAMNRICSFLDNYRLISNSDAHSPNNLAREANIFNCDLSYDGIFNALKYDNGFLGTIEFFPQEGKYHNDGHRNCQIEFTPLDTIRNNYLCPVCGKPVTRGVMHRVAELADRAESTIDYKNQTYSTITPLKNLIAEIFGTSANSKKVNVEYVENILKFGSELAILTEVNLQQLSDCGKEILAEGIKRLRNKQVYLSSGYDGEYGKIRVFSPEETKSFNKNQLFNMNSFFKEPEIIKTIEFDVPAFQKMLGVEGGKPPSKITSSLGSKGRSPLSETKVEGGLPPSKTNIITAGPGAGKTTFLVQQIITTLNEKKVKPNQVLAITFSNKAAEEIAERIKKKSEINFNNVYTFHRFGLGILKTHYHLLKHESDFIIIDENEKYLIIKKLLLNNESSTKMNNISQKISKYKNTFDIKIKDEEFDEIFLSYNQHLESINAFDLDDLIYQTVNLLENNQEILGKLQNRYQYIFVDEFQDLNYTQYKLIKLLSKNANLFAIGDPDQAIYGFRGSDANLITKLKDNEKNVTEIKLPISYRCPNNYLQLGAKIIDKTTFLTGRNEKNITDLKSFNNEKNEAEFIAETIEKMIGGTSSFSINTQKTDGSEYSGIQSFSDIAILARTSELFEPLIPALLRHGISYQLIDNKSIFDKEPFVSLVEIIRIGTRQNKGVKGDSVLFKEILPVANLCVCPEQTEPSVKNNPILNVTIKEMINNNISLEQIFQFIFDNYSAIPENNRKNILKFTKKFSNNYELFLQEVALRNPIDDFSINNEAVNLLTLHSAKGLEYKAVFIIGCEDNLLPFELFGAKTPEEIAEEARLFYVGITRSIKYLNLSYVRKRLYKNRLLEQQPSKFLKNVNPNLIKYQNILEKNIDYQLKLFT